jgi:branched-chain amino acid transport system ATP-binding protein
MALLEVDSVTVQFGGVMAVNKANFSVEAGSITGLIGPNGAGKTTTFNVITGLQVPTEGEVWFKGDRITKLSPYRRARMGMGRTFQRLEAFGSLSVWENIQAARDIRAGARSWWTNSADPVVYDLIDRVGLGSYIDDRADSLPTGVARLLELARALAIEPELLLLDEPSSGLDEGETEKFGDLLKDLAVDGCAILMVEHDIDLVFGVCEDIHVLDFGQIIASGSAAEIRNSPIVRAAYLGGSIAPVEVPVNAPPPPPPLDLAETKVIEFPEAVS